MATYVNDLRLKEIATGDESGTWGTSTNTNLELIAEAFSFGTESITTNADTHTTTIADGSTDPGRSIYLQYTGTLDSTCTITIGPNTVSKLWFIENATSGSQSIIIKQGSGATVTIANGQVKAIYSDGAGSGAAMVDAFQDLSVPDLFIDDDLTFTSDSAVITFGADGDTTLTHTDGTGLTLNSTNKLTFGDAASFVQQSSDGVLRVDGEATIDLNASTAVTVSNDLKLDSDSAVLGFGADNDTTLTHTDGTGLTLNSTNKLTFGDTASFVQQSSDGVLRVDGEATIDLNASTAVTVSNDLKLDSDAAVLGFGTDNDVTLTHVADTGLLLNSTMAIQFNDASQFINAPSATVLDINATDEIELNATLIDVNANLDVSGTYTGAGLMTTGGNIVIPDAGTIGSASDTDALAIGADGDITLTQDLELKHDGAILSFGADDDTTLTHTDGSGLTLNSTNKIMFNDASQFIQGSSATVLALGATDEIDLTATAIDVNGTMDVSGALTGTSATFTTADNTTQLTLKSTDDDASIGPVLDLTRDSASPAVDDNLGILRFRGDDSGGNVTNYAFLNCFIENPTDGAEDGLLKIETRVNSSSKERITIKSTELVINEEGEDLDFRVETNTDANALFVQGSSNRVMLGFNAQIAVAGVNPHLGVVGTDNGGTTLGVVRYSADTGGSRFILGKSRNGSIATAGGTIVQSGDTVGLIQFAADDGGDVATRPVQISAAIDGTPGSDDVPGRLVISTVPDGSSSISEALRITNAGNVGIGESSPAEKLEVAGNILLNASNAEVNLRSGATGTSGAINWTFNTDTTDFASIKLAYDDRNTTGLHIDSGYPITLDASGIGTIFAQSGSEKARIDSSGNVGIGQTSPGADLEIQRSGASTLRLTNAVNAQSADDIIGEIEFFSADNSSPGDSVRADITAINEDTSNNVALAFGTAANGGNVTERMRIGANGRVHIGSSSALSVGSNMDFTIQAQDGGAGASIVRNSNDAAAPSIQFAKSRGTAANAVTVVQDGDTLGNISFRGADGTDLNTKGADIIAQVDGTPGSNAMPGRLIFRTNDSSGTLTSSNEVFRIDSNQTAHFGATAAINSGAVTVNISGVNRALDVYRSTSVNGNIVFAAFSDVGGTKTKVFEVEANGDVENATGSYDTISDQRLKQDIVDANSQWSDIKALQIRNFKFINDVNQNGENALRHIGVVAQEVESSGMTGLVKTKIDEATGEEIKSVKSSIIYMKAVKALQEAMARIETLETELAKLKGGS
jgi:hypothetical protein